MWQIKTNASLVRTGMARNVSLIKINASLDTIGTVLNAFRIRIARQDTIGMVISAFLIKLYVLRGLFGMAVSAYIKIKTTVLSALYGMDTHAFPSLILILIPKSNALMARFGIAS